MNETPHLLTAATIKQLTETQRVHPLNPRAIRQTKSLGDILGMQRLGIHLVRVAPGDETTEFHLHYEEEEFIYILSGQGMARIGDTEYEVGAGDFMGFTAPSLPHTLKNSGTEDLVYLVGGERRPYEKVDYPQAKKRLFRIHEERIYKDL